MNNIYNMPVMQGTTLQRKFTVDEEGFRKFNYKSNLRIFIERKTNYGYRSIFKTTC